MKQLTFGLFTMLAFLLLAGCDDNTDNVVVNTKPEAPQGVYSITGDHQVFLYWNGPYQNNIREYIVWRSLQQRTNYAEIGRVTAESNPNLDLLTYEYVDNTAQNGTTYYYAVSTVDNDGRASDLSAENVYDTPRPEGDVVLFPKEVDSTIAGFNFEGAARMPWNATMADIYVDNYPHVLYLNAANINTDLQDMGYTRTFDDISVAPDSGWSKLGYVELIAGHTYVIWTAENRFAKLRINAINPSGTVSARWGFQTVAGNPELAPARKPVHGTNYLRTQVASQASK